MVKHINTIIVFLVCLLTITGLTCIKKYKAFLAVRELYVNTISQHNQIKMLESTLVPVNTPAGEIKKIISDVLLEINNTFGVKVFMEEGPSETVNFWFKTPLTLKIGLSSNSGSGLLAFNFFLEKLQGKPVQIESVKGNSSEVELKLFVVGR
jgi:hypothetical protein